MSVYATRADVEAYGVAVPAGAAGQAIIDRAERDVDRSLRGPLLDTGLRYNPAETSVAAAGYLTAVRKEALKRAVAAQTEYRLAKGEDFFIHAQHSRVSGPDFTTEGRLPYIGPKVYQELSGTGLAAGRLISVPLVGLLGRPDDGLSVA